MTLLNTADAVYLGGTPVDAVYLGSELVWPSGAAIPAEAQAFLDAAGITDPTITAAIAGLVTDLEPIRSKLHAVWPFVGGTAATHKFNLLDPRDADDAFRLTFMGGGTHSEALGYIPNPIGAVGNGAKADTHFVPLDHLSQNSTHLAYYSTRDTPAISACEMGNYNWNATGNRYHLIVRYTGDQFYYGMSEASATSTPSTDASGLFVGTRTGPNAQSAYRNGTHLATNTSASVTLPNNSTYIGGINDFNDRTDRSCGFASTGAGLSAADVAVLYDVVQAFQTVLGRAV